MARENIYKVGYLLFFNLAIVTALLLVLSLFDVLELIFLSNNVLSVSLVAFLTLTVFCKYNLNNLRNRNTQFIKSIFDSAPYFFLAILIILAVNQFAKISFITERNFVISALAIAFGFLAFYKNRDRVERELENEKQKEEDDERRRADEFEHKFPKISRVWGLRSVVKWGYKEGWGYSGILIAIIILGFILRIWNFFEIPYNHDEGIYYILFNNMSNNLIPTLDSGGLYFRNFIYTYLAYFANLFVKNTLISIRLVSLVFGTIIYIPAYLLSKKIFNKISAIVIVFFITINSYFITYSQQGRHYMLVMFFFILFLYYLFYKDINNKKDAITLTIILIILGTNYEFAFLLIPLIFIKYFSSRNKNYLYLTIALILLFLIQFLWITKLTQYSVLGFNPKKLNIISLPFDNINFFNHGFNKLFYFLSPFLISIIFLLITLFYNNQKNKSGNEVKILVAYFFMELLFFSFFFQRNQIRYRQSTIFLTVLLIGSLFYQSTINLSKNKKILMVVLVIGFYLLTHISLNYPSTYKYNKEDYISNYHLLSLIFTEPLGFSSIASNIVVSDYKIFSNYNLSDGVIIVSDPYNIIPYVNATYILNDFLKEYYTYQKNENSYSVYNNLQWIDLDYLKNLNKNQTIYLIADFKFRIHFNKETQNYIEKEFDLIDFIEGGYVGRIDLAEKNDLYVFKFKGS